MYPGFIIIGDHDPFIGATLRSVELTNNNRAYAYARQGGLSWVYDCDGCADIDPIVGPSGGYVSPAEDPAPWYDSSDPDTGDFYGVIGLEIVGGEGSTRTANVTPALAGGGVIGRWYDRPREMVLRALAIAADDGALMRGIEWLRDSYTSEGIGFNCGGEYMTYFDACPCNCCADDTDPFGPCWADTYGELKTPQCSASFWPATYGELRNGPTDTGRVFTDTFEGEGPLNPTYWQFWPAMFAFNPATEELDQDGGEMSTQRGMYEGHARPRGDFYGDQFLENNILNLPIPAAGTVGQQVTLESYLLLSKTTMRSLRIIFQYVIDSATTAHIAWATHAVADSGSFTVLASGTHAGVEPDDTVVSASAAANGGWALRVNGTLIASGTDSRPSGVRPNGGSMGLRLQFPAATPKPLIHYTTGGRPSGLASEWCDWFRNYYQLRVGIPSWTCGTDDCVAYYLRQLANVRVIAGPSVLRRPRMNSCGAMAELEFTIVAANPRPTKLLVMERG